MAQVIGNGIKLFTSELPALDQIRRNTIWCLVSDPYERNQLSSLLLVNRNHTKSLHIVRTVAQQIAPSEHEG